MPTTRMESTISACSSTASAAASTCGPIRERLALLRRRFDYCFETPPGSSYPAIVQGHAIENCAPVTIGGPGGDLHFQPFRQIHGDIELLGIRVGGVAYSCDLNDLPDDALPHLRDLDVWILNTLRYIPHPSHLTLTTALAWIDRIRPKRAILTHLHVDLDYDELAAQAPRWRHAGL